MPGNFHAVPEWVVAQWPKPNYIDPVRRPWLPALACVLLAFSTVLVSARFYLRARKQAGVFGLDDLFIFIGWLVSVGFSTSACIDSDRYGLDVHTWDVRKDQYVGAALTGWIAQILFIISTCATKTSVLLFYRRMAKDSYSQTWLYAIWAALGFTAAFFVGILITYCLICQPLDAYWLSYDLIYPYETPFKCIDGNILSPIVGVLSVVSDIYAVLLPCIWLHRYDLHVTRKQRVGLDIIFALGTIVAGCGIARTYYLWKMNHTYDTSWTGFNLFVWSLLECHLAIIFACAPSLRAFVRKYLMETFKGSRWSTNRTGNRLRDLECSPDASRWRNNSILTEPDLAKGNTTLEHRVLTKPSHGTLRNYLDDFSMRSQSSETMPNPKTADDEQALALQRLKWYKHSDTSEMATADSDDYERNDLFKGIAL